VKRRRGTKGQNASGIEEAKKSVKERTAFSHEGDSGTRRLHMAHIALQREKGEKDTKPRNEE